MVTPLQTGRPSMVERAFVFLVLLLSSGAFINLTIKAGADPTDQAGTQILWMVTYLCCLSLIVWKCPEVLRHALGQYLMMALTLFAVVSVLWSADPSMTVRRSVALILTCMFGAYLGVRFSVRQQLGLLAAVAVVCCVFSIVFGVLKLGTPSEDIPGAWYGVFVHKNNLGRMMDLSILVFTVAGRAATEHRWRFWLGSLVALLLLILSRSTTSVAVLAAMLGFLFVAPVLRRNLLGLIKWGTALVVASGALLYWALHHLEAVLHLFGKDLTLTGRLQLWMLSVVMALQRPWVGYGYSAFWLGPGSPSAKIVSVVQWDAPHAHNGLLELWLELGLIGVVLFLTGFVVYLGRAIVFFRNNRGYENVWPLCFLVFMFVCNLTESDFLARNTIFWIVYVAVVMNIAQKCESPVRTHVARPRQALVAPRVRECEG